MNKKFFFPSTCFFIGANYTSKPLWTSMRHSPYLMLAYCSLSFSPLLSLSPTCSQATFCTWISHSFIKIIPSLLSKLTPDVFLPLRLHTVCPPALSATISSLDLFVLIIYICIKLSSSWGRDLAFHALMKGYFHVQECRARRIQAKFRKYFQILYWNFYCNFAIG